MYLLTLCDQFRNNYYKEEKYMRKFEAEVENHNNIDSGVLNQSQFTSTIFKPNPLLSRPNAILEIYKERQRQVAEEGHSFEHDDESNQEAQLALAAAAYALPSSKESKAPEFWPWHKNWFKPKDHRRNLIRAGALILAEIERLDRMQAAGDRAKENSQV